MSDVAFNSIIECKHRHFSVPTLYPRTLHIMQAVVGYPGLGPCTYHACCGDSCPHVFEQLPPHMWRADEDCPRCATPRFKSGSSGRLKPRMPFYDFGLDRQLQVSMCLVVTELIAVQRAYACGHTVVCLCSPCLMTHWCGQ